MKNMLRVAAAAVALSSVTQVFAFDWVTNTVGFRYGQQFTNPNNPDQFSKRIYNFTHANGYSLGSNFFNVDVFLSDSRDPRKGADHGGSEVYAVYRNQLFASRVFDTSIGTGLIKDYALTTGFDVNRNNNLASSNKRAWVFGPTIKFNTMGVLDLSLLYFKDKNQTGIPGAKHEEKNFDGTYNLNLTWMRPFHLGNHAAKFQGFFNHIGSKGGDYNDNDTVPETLIRTSMMVAAIPGKNIKPNIYFGVGYEYWHNKFGVDGGRGSRTSTPTLNMEITF